MKKYQLSSILFFFTFLSLISFIAFSCSNSSEPAYVPEPGRRDYIWTMDTIKIPFTILQSIWGSSPNDIWAVGPGGDLDKTIFHFDGFKWKSDGIVRNLSPLGIWGTTSNNIWICAMEGKIWHFNGFSWAQDTVISLSNFISLSFQDIWGDEESNLYAVGHAQDIHNKFIGVLFHYNGKVWNKISVQEEFCSFLKIKKCDGCLKYFIFGVTQNQASSDTFKIFEYSNNKMKNIYSGTGSKNEFPYFEKIGNNILFVIGMNVYKYNNNKFEKYFELHPNTNHALSGRNMKDVFLSLKSGIAHFNGSNIENLYEFSNSDVRIIDELILEKDVFFLAYDFSKSIHIIIKGHLN